MSLPEVRPATLADVPALFAATLPAARSAGLGALTATIRTDSLGWQACYAGLGFLPLASEPEFRLSTGVTVGRSTRRFTL